MEVFIIGGIILWALSLLLLATVIRVAIDSSRMSRRIDALVAEVEGLRKDIKASKHIIDKKV